MKYIVEAKTGISLSDLQVRFLWLFILLEIPYIVLYLQELQQRRKGERISMAMKKYNLDKNSKLTDEQFLELKEAALRPLSFDEDCPELTDEELARFKRIAEINKEERRKQSVTLRLSPHALKKAKSLGKGYTSVLSRILESALDDNELLKKSF